MAAKESSRRDCLRSCEYSPVRHADCRQRSSPSAVFGPPRAPCIRQTLYPRTAGFRQGCLSCFRRAVQRGASRIKKRVCRYSAETRCNAVARFAWGPLLNFHSSLRVCARDVLAKGVFWSHRVRKGLCVGTEPRRPNGSCSVPAPAIGRTSAALLASLRNRATRSWFDAVNASTMSGRELAALHRPQCAPE